MYFLRFLSVLIIHKNRNFLFCSTRGTYHFALTSKEKSVDITAHYKDKLFAIECKFIKSSEKFESYFRRLYLACRKCENIPILLAETFSFPPANKVKEVGPEHCHVIKDLLRNVIKNKNETCKVVLFKQGEEKSLEFYYMEKLPINTVPIRSQGNFAEACAFKFAQGSLKNTIDTAVGQLNDNKYTGYKKIIFMNLQKDSLYCAPWTELAMEKLKYSMSSTTLCKHSTTLIFSNDVGFSIDL